MWGLLPDEAEPTSTIDLNALAELTYWCRPSRPAWLDGAGCQIDSLDAPVPLAYVAISTADLFNRISRVGQEAKTLIDSSLFSPFLGSLLTRSSRRFLIETTAGFTSTGRYAANLFKVIVSSTRAYVAHSRGMADSIAMVAGGLNERSGPG